jgi:hypothetical protein
MLFPGRAIDLIMAARLHIMFRSHPILKIEREAIESLPKARI